MTKLAGIFFLLIGITYPLIANATESAKKDTNILPEDKAKDNPPFKKEKETPIKSLSLIDKPNYGKAEPFKPVVTPPKKDTDPSPKIYISPAFQKTIIPSSPGKIPERYSPGPSTPTKNNVYSRYPSEILN